MTSITNLVKRGLKNSTVLLTALVTWKKSCVSTIGAVDMTRELPKRRCERMGDKEEQGCMGVSLRDLV